MTDPVDPPRLVDSNEIPDELRQGLQGLRAHVPSSAQMAALSDRLGVEQMTAPAAASPASAVLAKALIGVGVAVGGAGLLWFLRSGSPDAVSNGEKPQAAVAARAPVSERKPVADEPTGSAAGTGAASPRAADTAENPGTRTVDTPAGAENVKATDRTESRGGAEGSGRNPQSARAPATVGLGAKAESPSSPARAPSSVAGSGGAGSKPQESPKSGESEIALLRDARATLAVDPAEALAITERHRASFPRGALGQEREMIAITALVKLGRTDAAQKRAEQFRAAHPTSAYLVQLERILPKK
jgi:hypothetical protein